MRKTRAQVIVQTVVDRLEAFADTLTDPTESLQVWNGRRDFEEVDLCASPHVTVFALTESVEQENDCALKNTLSVRIEGHAQVTEHESPADWCHWMVGAIKSAVFLETPTPSFSTEFRLVESEFVYPSDGSEVCQASVEIAVNFTEPKTAIFIDEV